MLRVAFLTRPTSPALEIVHAVDGSPVHCALFFADGRTFSSAPPAGAAWASGLDPAPGAPGSTASDWLLLPVPPHVDPARVAAWCDGVQGARYDWLADVGCYAGLGVLGEYNCSRVVGGALVAGGESPTLVARSGTPRLLFNVCTERWPTAALTAV